MSLKNARKAVSAVVNNVTKDRQPTIKLRDFSVDENGLARIVASVTHTSTSRENDGEVYAAISSLFKNNIQPIENTFCILASNAFTDMVTGIVAPIQESVAFDSESDDFTCVCGNMYVDENEKLWSLKKTEGGDLLIKTSSLDDLDAINELMGSVSSDAVEPLRFETESNVMTSFCSMLDKVAGGDFIDFVNPTTRCAEFGVVVANVQNEDTETGTIEDTGSVIVLSSTGEHHVSISREMIVGVHTDVEVPESDDSAYETMSGTPNLEAAVAYYRSMFRRSPEYFAMFEQRLRNHAFFQ